VVMAQTRLKEFENVWGGVVYRFNENTLTAVVYFAILGFDWAFCFELRWLCVFMCDCLEFSKVFI